MYSLDARAGSLMEKASTSVTASPFAFGIAVQKQIYISNFKQESEAVLVKRSVLVLSAESEELDLDVR